MNGLARKRDAGHRGDVRDRACERRGGTIINVTTMAAEVGMAGLGVYGASKAAVALLTKALGGRVRPARSPRQHGLARPHEYARHGGVYRPEPTNLELAKESA